MNKVDEVVSILKKGGVVICPTDTVYGFLADAHNKKAVEKIYGIKKRSKSKPLPVFVKDIAMARELAEVDEKATNFLKKNWPGKVTVVLKRKKGIKLYGVVKETIALRIPKHSFLNALLKKIDRPLVQTSVNLSGRESMIYIKDIIEMFRKEKRVAMIIDGGDLKKGKPSKIMDFTSKSLTRLR